MIQNFYKALLFDKTVTNYKKTDPFSNVFLFISLKKKKKQIRQSLTLCLQDPMSGSVYITGNIDQEDFLGGN